MDTDIRQPVPDPADRLLAWADSVLPDASRARSMVPATAADLVAAIVADNLLTPGISPTAAACWIMGGSVAGWAASCASREGLRWLHAEFVGSGMPGCNAWVPRAVLAALGLACGLATAAVAMVVTSLAASRVQVRMLAAAAVFHEQGLADGTIPAPAGRASPFRGCGSGTLHASDAVERPADDGKSSLSVLLSRDGCPTRAEFIGTFGKPRASAFGSHPELLSSSVRIHPVTGLAANPVHR